MEYKNIFKEFSWQLFFFTIFHIKYRKINNHKNGPSDYISKVFWSHILAFCYYQSLSLNNSDSSLFLTQRCYIIDQSMKAIVHPKMNIWTFTLSDPVWSWCCYNHFNSTFTYVIKKHLQNPWNYHKNCPSDYNESFLKPYTCFYKVKDENWSYRKWHLLQILNLNSNALSLNYIKNSVCSSHKAIVWL